MQILYTIDIAIFTIILRITGIEDENFFNIRAFSFSFMKMHLKSILKY